MALDSINGGVVEQLIVDDIETIAQQFQDSFSECVSNVQKPNVLVAGVTGAGKLKTKPSINSPSGNNFFFQNQTI
jgi:hypothetical protein